MEIVLAIGIMAFALVGILGLFPVALETARDSKSETHMALIARQIEADVRSSQIWEVSPPSGGIRTLTWSARIANAGTAAGAGEIAQYAPLQISSAFPAVAASTQTTHLAYAPDANQQLLPLGTVFTGTQFENGVAGAAFIARVEATYNDPDHPDLVRLDITLGAPGSAPATARHTQTFTTLMGQR